MRYPARTKLPLSLRLNCLPTLYCGVFLGMSVNGRMILLKNTRGGRGVEHCFSHFTHHARLAEGRGVTVKWATRTQACSAFTCQLETESPDEARPKFNVADEKGMLAKGRGVTVKWATRTQAWTAY